LKNARFECRACGRQTSATAGTIFEGTRKPLRLWFQAITCVTDRRQGASALALQRLLQLPSYQTAWAWLHKLRRAMAREDPLQGAVEVDIAALWGLVDFGEEQLGVVIGAEVDGRRIGRIRMRLVRNGRPRYVQAFVEECVARGSTIRTDDWEGGAVWAQNGYIHEDCPGRDGTAFARMPRVNWVAVRLKRWLAGTHAGAVSQAQLRYYLDEFTFRFNARRCKDPWNLFERLVRQTVTTAPVGIAGSWLGRDRGGNPAWAEPFALINGSGVYEE
jgi:hypothetical protein